MSPWSPSWWWWWWWWRLMTLKLKGTIEKRAAARLQAAPVLLDGCEQLMKTADISLNGLRK